MSDMLAEIFETQARLNDHTFRKSGIRGPGGEPLTTAALREALRRGELDAAGLPNQWLRNYLWALRDECRELDEELLKKWWSRDRLDVQNIRVEIVDMLHFLVSLALTADLDAEDLHRLYIKKNEINLQRQDSGYSRASKTEADNETVV